jgi:hypothetical protein
MPYKMSIKVEHRLKAMQEKRLEQIPQPSTCTMESSTDRLQQMQTLSMYLVQDPYSIQVQKVNTIADNAGKMQYEEPQKLEGPREIQNRPYNETFGAASHECLKI